MNAIPKIADFGLAKRLDDDSSQTQSGTILGTPSYMAPEQAEGKNREIGPAADIYSLGAILYELLTGRPPFKAGNPIDTIRQVIEQEPVPPRQLEPRRAPRPGDDLPEVPGKGARPALRHGRGAGRRPAPFLGGRPDPRPADAGLGTRLEMGQTPAGRSWRCWASALPPLWPWCCSSSGTTSRSQGKLDEARAEERLARQREQDALEGERLSLLQHEGQKLFNDGQLAVAARDWTNARLHLKKALTTIGGEPRLGQLEGARADPARRRSSENCASRPTGRRPGRASSNSSHLRDEAQFLGTCTPAWIWPPT